MSSYFKQAQNFTINGLNQIEIHNEKLSLERRKELAFEILQREVVRGASHNSKERYDAPKCHPETREAVLSNIKSWLDSNIESTSTLWLNGPAGAGKSAIAQTTAINCHAEGKLAASFFFSRYSSERSKKDGLVATLAYQVCISIPATRDYIVENIVKDPNIFYLDVKTQLHLLIVEPLCHVNQESFGWPKLRIIDGLDECQVRIDQAEIIEAFATSFAMNTGSGLCVLFASRPELEIRQAFNSDLISSLCTWLVLDDTFNPDKDIYLYLRSHFHTIKRQHVISSTIPASWPSEKAIDRIVQKSSGQFIYASTVIKYISESRRDPMKRLDTILKILPTNGDKPFAELDALYFTILSVCEDYKKVALIFEAMMFIAIDGSGKQLLRSVENLEHFLTLKGEIMLLLADLHSIVDVNNIHKMGFRFYHASLHDFLTDSSRSHQLFIDKHNAHALISIRCLEFLVNAPAGFPNAVFDYSLKRCFYHYMDSGWDDRVLKYILEQDILKPNNRHPFQRQNSHVHSMLGKLIINIGRQLVRGINAHAYDMIDAEFLNHLKLYPQQDIIIVLYQLLETTGDLGPVLELHSTCKTSFNLGNKSIINDELFENNYVKNWFKNLMKATGYISKLPEDVRLNAILRMLDISLGHSVHSGTKCLQNIFENIKLSSAMVGAVLEKWNIVKLDHDRSGGVPEEIDGYIRSNCQKAGKKMEYESAHLTKDTPPSEIDPERHNNTSVLNFKPVERSDSEHSSAERTQEASRTMSRGLSARECCISSGLETEEKKPKKKKHRISIFIKKLKDRF